MRQDNASRTISKAMKIYSCYTSSHEELFDDYFHNSLPSSLESCAHFVDVDGPGNFQDVGFLETIKEKLHLIIESIEANPGSVIIWSDVDIAFLRDPTSSIEEMFDDDRDLDIAFQREGKIGKDVNTGFIVMRCSDRVKAFYEEVVDVMAANPHWNEQAATNHLLSGDCQANWAYLPMTFCARSHGWPPPQDRVLYHANVTSGADGVGQKKAQLRDLAFIDRHGTPALLWLGASRIARKVLRRLSRIAAASAGAGRSGE